MGRYTNSLATRRTRAPPPWPLPFSPTVAPAVLLLHASSQLREVGAKLLSHVTRVSMGSAQNQDVSSGVRTPTASGVDIVLARRTHPKGHNWERLNNRREICSIQPVCFPPMAA